MRTAEDFAGLERRVAMLESRLDAIQGCRPRPMRTETPVCPESGLAIYNPAGHRVVKVDDLPQPPK